MCHADRHALAAEAVGHPGDSGRHDLGIRMGVTTHLVPASVNLAAQRGLLQQDIFQPEAKTLLDHILWHRQFQLRLFHPERPFQHRLHAQRAFCLCTTSMPNPSLHAHRCNPSNRVICAGPFAPSVGRQIHGPEAMGSCESAPRMCCCQWVNSVAEQAQSA